MLRELFRLLALLFPKLQLASHGLHLGLELLNPELQLLLHGAVDHGGVLLHQLLRGVLQLVLQLGDPGMETLHQRLLLVLRSGERALPQNGTWVGAVQVSLGDASPQSPGSGAGCLEYVIPTNNDNENSVQPS